jgi:hypothetical protein
VLENFREVLEFTPPVRKPQCSVWGYNSSTSPATVLSIGVSIFVIFRLYPVLQTAVFGFMYPRFLLRELRRVLKFWRRRSLKATVLWVIASCSVVGSSSTFQRCLVPPSLEEASISETSVALLSDYALLRHRRRPSSKQKIGDHQEMPLLFVLTKPVLYLPYYHCGVPFDVISLWCSHFVGDR